MTLRRAPIPCRVVALLGVLVSAGFPAVHGASIWEHRTIAVQGQNGIASIRDAAINDRGDVAVVLLRTVDVGSGQESIFRLEGEALVPVVLPGAVLPGGLGTLADIGVNSGRDLGDESIALDPIGRILFTATVQNGTLPGSPAMHLFRAEGASITHLGSISDPASHVFGENFLQFMLPDGRWMLVRENDSDESKIDRQFRLTDGVTTGPAIATMVDDNTLASDCTTRQFAPAGLTAEGHLIGAETEVTLLTTGDDATCGSGGSVVRVTLLRFAEGAEPVTIAEEVRAEQPGGIFTGNFIHHVIANRRGDVVFRRVGPLNDLSQLVRRTATTQSILYAESTQPDPGLVTFDILHDLDEEGRVVWSGNDGAVQTDTVFAGTSLGIDRVIGVGDIDEGVEVRALEVYGVAHPVGALSDQRQILIRYQGQITEEGGLVLAGRAGTRWINPESGSWSTATNWASDTIPGNVDAAIFDQEASYDVTVGTRTVGRALVENGSVGFQSSDLTLTGPLLVGGDATLTLPEGTLKAGELTVGHLPPTDPAAEPTARLNASGASLVLDVSGPVVVGNAGQGEMFVTQGKVNSGELRIGSGSDGIVTLGFDDAEWHSIGSIAVGHTHRGTLNIERGAAMNTDGIVSIGTGATPPDDGGGGGDDIPASTPPGSVVTTSATIFSTGTPGGKVVIDSAGTTLPQSFNLLATAIRVGDGLPGELEIRNGGFVGLPEGPAVLTTAHAAAPTAPFDARILVTGVGSAVETSSVLFNLGGASLGQAPSSLTLVQIEDGGVFLSSESVILAAAVDSSVDVIVRGVHANGKRSELLAGKSPDTEHHLHIGLRGEATVSVLDGGLLSADDIFIGGRTGSRGTLIVGGRSGGTVATVEVQEASGLGSLLVGGTLLANGDNDVPGELILNDGEVRTQFFDVTTAGIVRGQGRISFTGTLELGGTIDPAIGVTRPAATRPATGQSHSRSFSRTRVMATTAAASASGLRPGTLTLEGNVVLAPTARVVLDLVGASPGAADRIVVEGALTLGGTLELCFTNGYAPRAGDVLDLFSSTTTTGSFATTTITGLAPGFDFTLEPNGAGGVRLTAVNDAVPATAVGSRLANLSVRTPMVEGQNLIVGFVVSGGAKPVLVRAAGPGLASFVDGTHPDPRITLFDGAGAEVDANDNWPDTLAPIMQTLGAFPFASASLDAAVERSANASYTAHVNGPGAGIMLVELYDAQDGVTPRLVNASARNHVGTGAAVLIAGFVVEGTSPKTLLVRGVGPGLLAHDVPGVLADPQLALFDDAGAVLAENDDWSGSLASVAAAVGAFALTPGSKDAALLITLEPGIYTAHVAGVGGTTGEALIEIYEAP